MTDLEKLLSEFAAKFESGDEPDPGTFISRADAQERAELAGRIDAYLDTAPTQKWDPGAYTRSPARRASERVFESFEGEAGTWPELLPRLRNRAQIKRDELTRKLANALGFGSDPDVRRVHAYYHRMEHGQLPAAGVDDRVLDALASLVGSSRDALRTAGERLSGADAAAGSGAFARTAMPRERYVQDSMLRESDEPSAPAARPASSLGITAAGGRAKGAASAGRSGRDELDELFLGRNG